MLDVWFGSGPQVEILPDLHELALTNLTDQNDRHCDLRARRRFVRRRWPFVGDDCRMYVFPAKFCPFGIRKNVCGFDTQSGTMRTCRYGSRRQLLDLIDSIEGFTGGHDLPLAAWVDEFVEALDVVGGECGRERLDEVGTL